MALACAGIGTVSAEEETEIEEIVVTAQKREALLSDIPFAMQALTGEEIEKHGLTRVEDLFKIIPSATVTQSSSTAVTTFSIRGISTYVEMDPTVAHYIDEVPFSLPATGYAPTANLFDLERVEIIRSPQGTLYGESSMGGVVRLITADPDLDSGFSGKIKLTGTTVKEGDSGFGGDLAMNIPMVDGKLAGRLMVSYHELGAYLDSPDFEGGSEDINDVDKLNVRGKLLFQPRDDFSMKFSYWHHETDEPFGNTVDLSDPSERFLLTGGGLTAYEVDYDIYAGFLRKEFDFATLEYSGSYLDWTMYFPVSLPIGGFGVYDADFGFASDANTHELRLLSANDGPLTWVAGFYYREGSKEFTLQDGEFRPLFVFPDEVTRIDSEAWAAFGEASYEFMDGLVEVLVGLRWFDDERQFTQDIDGGGRVVDTDSRYDSLSPRLNVTLRPSEQGMIFFNAAKGFRSGTMTPFAAIVGTGAFIPPGTDLSTTDSDELWSYEAGVKWDFLDGDLSVEVVGYYTDWEDVQLLYTFFPGIGANVNVGDAELMGIDYSVSYRTPVGLSLSISGNFNDTEWKSVDPLFAAGAPLGSQFLAEGEDLPAVPDQTYHITADYSTMVNERLEFFAFANYSFRDEQVDIGGLGDIADKLRRLSMRLGVRFQESWEVSVFANNLLDEDGVVSIINGGAAGVLRPREFGVSVARSF